MGRNTVVKELVVRRVNRGEKILFYNHGEKGATAQ